MSYSAIRNFARHCPQLKSNQEFYLGLTLRTVSSAIIKKINFPTPPAAGNIFLPPTNFGPISRFNAYGKLMVDKQAGKETVSYPIHWSWVEWHGNERVEKEDVRYRNIERWKRKQIPPPSIELQILNNTKGELLILSPLLKNKINDNEALCHVFNLFKEIFGLNPEVFNAELNEIIKAKVINLNWTTLPPGNMPWNKMKAVLSSVVKSKTTNQQYVINYRFEKINSYNPDFVATGNLGFQGYIVFGFTSKSLFILESIHKDNATYVFDTNWQVLSQKTKSEIIHHTLYKHRVIHKSDWNISMDKILK